MKLKVFTVYDSKAEAYLQPFFSVSTGAAVRMFSDAITDSNHQFHKHAADYTLFHIGEYDDTNGLLKAVTPVSLGNALEYKSAPALEPLKETFPRIVNN